MPLSRKHYQSIAAIFKAHSRRALNDAGDNGGADIWVSIRDDIADYLANDNPNFDRDHFRRATEPDGKGEPDAPGEPAKLEPLTRTLTGLKQSIAEAPKLTDPIATHHSPGAYSVAWFYYSAANLHTIQYGQQTKSYNDSLAAGHEFGECVRHSLECNGEFDPD